MELEEKPQLTIRCDWSGCKNFLNAAYPSHAEAAKAAIGAGWITGRVNGVEVHYCPDHKNTPAIAPATESELDRLRRENGELRAQIEDKQEWLHDTLHNV